MARPRITANQEGSSLVLTIRETIWPNKIAFEIHDPVDGGNGVVFIEKKDLRKIYNFMGRYLGESTESAPLSEVDGATVKVGGLKFEF